MYVWVGEECGPPGQGLTEEHTDCGWVGIDRDTCNKRGCCYIKNQACFYPKSKCGGFCHKDSWNYRVSCKIFRFKVSFFATGSKAGNELIYM